MNLNQVNLTYQPVEDRLLFRINTLDQAEFRLWLTRALVSRLLEGFDKMEELVLQEEGSAARFAAGPLQVMQEIQREAEASHSDFKTAFSPTASVFPLGETPVLAVGGQLRREDGQTLFTLDVAGGTSFTVILDGRLLMSLHKLLLDVLVNVPWGLAVSPANLMPTPSGRPVWLH